MPTLYAIVLAAGQGKRMKSTLNKVLHPAAGRPLVYYSVAAALAAGAEGAVVVVSPDNRGPVEKYLGQTFGAERIQTVVQEAPRGTGDAARLGLDAVSSERVLLLYGDTPLLDADELRRLVRALDEDREALLALLSCVLADPGGYGRVIRDRSGRVREVREDRDLRDAGERAVQEVNAGVYAADSRFLREALAELSPANAQGEYYLTDAVSVAAARGGALASSGRPETLLGVNDRSQLAQAEAILFRRILEGHGRAGVTVHGAPCIDDTVSIEPDVTIDAQVRLRGNTQIEAGARIDVGCVITDSRIGACAEIKPYSVIVSAVVEAEAQIGPFSHLRPESHIETGAHVGNFVETKKTRMRKGAKANHLAYLGDADIGAGANIGAGTIFCNYDGFQKHKTVIKDGAFVGSDSQLVAPVTVGQGAYVATGTTVTEDVPDDALAIGRARQQNKEGYASKLRARLRDEAAAKARSERK